ncbi:trypsin-like peptidase domain-containing protein [Roseburia hominis]
MDNQYSYYRPDDDGNNANKYQEPQRQPKAPKHTNGFVKKALVIAGLAIIFGGVAGVTFQGTSYVAGKLLGISTKEEKVSKTKEVAHTNVSTTKTSVTSDVSDIVSETIPSIVSITNMSVQQVQSFFGGISEQESKSAGSGIIISKTDKELLVVTNNHVVEGSETLTITFSDGKSVEAVIKGTDSSRDLAVVAVPLENIDDDTLGAIKVATLGDSDELKVGEPAIAIGNALGYGQSVTTGIISATQRSMEGFEGVYIQTDAAINPGNSGGALLNINGEVVGINSAKINNSAVEGMGFAIPITDAHDIIQNLMNKETRSKVAESERGVIGIKGYDVKAEYAQLYNMPTGVYIDSVIEGGGADKAGLSKGTVISAFEGTAIYSMNDLKQQLEYYKAGEEVTLTINVPERNGEYSKEEVTVTLGKNS